MRSASLDEIEALELLDTLEETSVHPTKTKPARTSDHNIEWCFMIQPPELIVSTPLS
jgi:hypothetical protein